MNFINPVDILDLKSTDPTSIDSGLVKKAKKRLQADIELSDSDFFDYKGIKVTKTDIDWVVNSLDNKEKIEFYHFIANYKELNEFLVNGNPQIFSNFRHESIYKLKSFIEFISPYFSQKYDLCLFKAFETEGYDYCKSILENKPLVTSSDFDKSYASLIASIKDRIREVDKTTASIRNEESIYDETDIDEVYNWASERLYGHLISLLPKQFQSIKNQTAKCLRNLGVNVFNTFNNSEVALQLIDHALEIEPDGITYQRIAEDRDKIQEIDEQRAEQERHAPIIKKYANVLIKIKDYLDKIEKDVIITPSNVLNNLSNQVSSSELNQLDDVFSEIRNHIALAFRALSVSIWNKYSNIEVALALVNTAYEIKSNQATESNIREARNQLLTLKTQIDAVRVAKEKEESSSNNGCLVLIGIAVVIWIIIAIVNSNDSSSSNNHNSYTPQSTTPSTSPSNEYSTPSRIESPYKGNQLKNGASPFDACFGKGIYGGQGTIKFENSNNYDVVISLVEFTSGRTIRNEYIRKGATFSMTNLPNGRYYIKGYYGNDWNPTATNFCGTSGAFDSDAHFSKSDNWNDTMEITGYEEWTVTLYSVTNGNMSTKSTNAADYFKN